MHSRDALDELRVWAWAVWAEGVRARVHHPRYDKGVFQFHAEGLTMPLADLMT